MPANNFPKLHNAMWPGLVGKGSPGAEPFIELDTMLDMTAKAEVGGVKFDGVDLFLYNPHTDIDISDDGIKALANKIKSKGLVVGSVVAPVWFDASAGGDEKARANFVTHVRKAIRIAASDEADVVLSGLLDRDVPGVLSNKRYGEESRLSIRGSGIDQSYHQRGVLMTGSDDGMVQVSHDDGATVRTTQGTTVLDSLCGFASRHQAH